ncbi:ABC transporter permease [Paenibacillus sp. FSL K6-2859]|jgi:teichoic acid transport system permease protein|uniref:ABC transporter permease n=1 Tax=Paenibacillus sp. FSL K6-2859 TaxID=2921482 RepID=UPI0030FBB317
MSKSDFKSRFSGSYFGVVWAVIQPLMTILIFWFVFQVGFRAQPISNVPFILWLVAAMIPWNFFADAIINSTGAFTSYSFVVKKMVFKIGLLPLVKVTASFFLNIAFNILLIIIYTAYGHFPGVHLISILYFNVCLFAFVTVLAYLISTLNVFFRDTTQIVGILLQFGIWLTPIMWEESVIPEKFRWLIKLNPIYYIINGYREALINHTWFFAHPRLTIYFWAIIIVIGLIGISFYKRMKSHFADVL